MRAHRPAILDASGKAVPCLVEGCTEIRERRNGYCDPHYWRNRRTGSPTGHQPGRIVGSNADRFWPLVDKNGPIPDYAPHLGRCWIWNGSKVDGYGNFRYCLSFDGPYLLNTQIRDNGIVSKTLKAHRISYTWAKGAIPHGLFLDHLCRVRSCVNPDHLEPVTTLENLERNPEWAKYKTGSDSPNFGKKRPISWYHNKHHIRGRSTATMSECPDCNAVDYSQNKGE